MASVEHDASKASSMTSCQTADPARKIRRLQGSLGAVVIVVNLEVILFGMSDYQQEFWIIRVRFQSLIYFFAVAWNTKRFRCSPKVRCAASNSPLLSSFFDQACMTKHLRVPWLRGRVPATTTPTKATTTTRLSAIALSTTTLSFWLGRHA